MTSSSRIRYLPTFYRDLMSTLMYISEVLQNKSASRNLFEDIERSIMKEAENPAITEPYRSRLPLRKTYYRIKVRNYYIFYTMEDGIMEISRLIYARRDVTI